MKNILFIVSILICNISFAGSYDLLTITDNIQPQLQSEPQPEVVIQNDETKDYTNIIIGTVVTAILSSIYPVYYYYKKRLRDRARNRIIKLIKNKFKEYGKKDLNYIEKEILKIVREEIDNFKKEQKNV